MNPPQSPYRSVTSALLACALLLRVLVPAGYMPTNTADGWYLQLCPDGLSAHTMAALFGHKHHHADHQADDQLDESAFAQCDLGGGLTADALTNASGDSIAAFEITSQTTSLSAWLPTRNLWNGFRPRAPPAPI